LDIRLAAFDMDGTILKHESSWVAIHRSFGTERVGKASLKLYTEGKIDYREFMRRDIASWPKQATKEEISAILSGYEVRDDARVAVRMLADLGVKTAIVSSGIDLLARKVARELGMDYSLANGLRFDRTGRLLPEGIGRVDPTRKDIAYLKLLSRLGIESKDTIAVGDTLYDLAFLKSAGRGFLLAHSTRVEDPEIVHIEKLTDILSLI
jgi:phosphoserine phosphatase